MRTHVHETRQVRQLRVAELDTRAVERVWSRPQGGTSGEAASNLTLSAISLTLPAREMRTHVHETRQVRQLRAAELDTRAFLVEGGRNMSLRKREHKIVSPHRIP